MRDSYEGLAQDIQSSFHAARTLRDAFQRDGSTRAEFSETLTSLRQDLAELRLADKLGYVGHLKA